MNPAIKQKIVPGVAKILAFVIDSSETDVDDNILNEIADALKEVQAQSEGVTAKDVLEGVFEVADGVTDLTPTPIDDTIVNIAKGATEFGGLTDKINGWVSGWFN